MAEYLRIPNVLTPRDKNIKGNRKHWSFSNTYSCYFWLEPCNSCSNTNGLMFMQLVKCFTNRNEDADYKTMLSRHHTYWNPYISASDCRKLATYFRDALKRKTVYMVEKPFKVKNYYDGYEKVPVTMVITKRPYTQEKLFMKALCNDGIREINAKEKAFYFRVLKFMEKSKGVWF